MCVYLWYHNQIPVQRERERECVPCGQCTPPLVRSTARYGKFLFKLSLSLSLSLSLARSLSLSLSLSVSLSAYVYRSTYINAMQVVVSVAWARDSGNGRVS